MDLTSSQGQSRFGRERGSIADSLDMDSLRVSSPRGALFDGSIRISSPGGFDSSRRESSPGARGFGGLSSPGWSFDRNGNGQEEYKNAFAAFNSPKSNAFGSPRSNAFRSPKNSFGSSKNSLSFFGNSSFDAIPSLFGGSPGASRREDPFGLGGGSFLRFDSFGGLGSPAGLQASEVLQAEQIRELMKVDSLTNDEVKSHLQKYRLHTRRPSPSPSSPSPHAPQLVVLGWMRPDQFKATVGAASQAWTRGVCDDSPLVIAQKYIPAQSIERPQMQPLPVLQKHQPAISTSQTFLRGPCFRLHFSFQEFEVQAEELPTTSTCFCCYYLHGRLINA